MKIASQKICRSVSVLQVLVCAIIAILLGQSCVAQDRQSSVIVRSHADVQVKKLSPVIEAIQSKGFSNFTLRISEQPGMSVEIQSVLPENEYADLVESLTEKGVESVRVLPLPFEPVAYSPERLEAARGAKGVIVFFRADWCLTCKLVEGKVFANQEFLRLAHDSSVPFLVADMTEAGGESEAVKLARQEGVKDLPTFVFFPSDPEEDAQVIVGGALPEKVIDSLREHLQREDP